MALKIASVFGRDFVLGDLRRALQTLNDVDIAADLFNILTDIVNNSALLRWKSIGINVIPGLALPILGSTTAGPDKSTPQQEGRFLAEDLADKLQFEFADQSVVEAVYSLMLNSQTAQVHEIIGDMNETRYFKDAYSGPLGKAQGDLQQHQIYDLIVHYRKSGNIEKNVKYLTLAAKTAFDLNNSDSANLLLIELLKIASAGRGLSDALLDSITPQFLSRPSPLSIPSVSSLGTPIKEKFGALAASLSIDTSSPNVGHAILSPSSSRPKSVRDSRAAR